MHLSTPLRTGLLSLVLLAAGQSHAQSPTDSLSAHIVRTTINGVEAFMDDRTPTIQDTSICFLYIGRKQDGVLWLRLQVRYSDFRRLNMQQVIFQKDDRRLVVDCAAELLHHDDNGMVQWEWYDTLPSENEMRAIQVIVSEPGVTLTLVGRETLTRPLSENERLAMQNVLGEFNRMAHSRR